MLVGEFIGEVKSGTPNTLGACVSFLRAVTQYHKAGLLSPIDNRGLWSPGSEGQKSKFKVSAGPGSADRGTLSSSL